MCRNKAEMPMVTADWTLLDAVEATLLNSVVQAIAEREKRKATRGRELAGLAQTHVAAQVDVESGRRRIGAALDGGLAWSRAMRLEREIRDGEAPEGAPPDA